jgi:hypothetical protein
MGVAPALEPPSWPFMREGKARQGKARGGEGRARRLSYCKPVGEE